MNADRRKAIDAVISQIEELAEKARSLAADVESIKDEEDDYLSNMPESFQNGEKGEAAQTAIDALDNAYSELDGLDSTLDEILSHLGEAKGE
jgi:seryl-tRNA synthetase